MMKRMIMSAAALLALSAGIAYAAIPNTSDFLHRTTPMITGTVFTVDDRQIVVDTDQGQQVTLVMDSRTMLPTDLAPGMLMRAEFRVMENGQYYVNRITPIRDAGMANRSDPSWRQRSDASDLTRSNETLAYAHPAEGEQVVSAEQPVTTESPESREAMPASEPLASNSEPEALPQTASRDPLIALLGLLALSGAGVLMLSRRIHRA